MATLPQNKKLPNKPKRDLQAQPVRNQGKDKNKTKPKPNRSGGRFGGDVDGPGGFKGVNKNQVRQLVNGILRDELRGLRGERRDINRDSRAQGNQIRADYRSAKGDLSKVYGETSDYLGQLNSRQNSQYGAQQQQMATANEALQRQLEGTYSGAQVGASDELARLGIQGGGNLSGLVQDQAYNQGTAAIAGQNAMSTAAQSQANNQGALAQIMGMNQGSLTSGMGRILNERNQSLSENRQGRNDAQQKLQEAIRDVRGSRGDLFMQLLSQLQQTGWSQYMDAQQLKMQRRQLNK